MLNELPKAEIKAYSIETIIAEKFHAMIVLGTLNSRMKDFYDVYMLLKNNDINTENLKTAVLHTFRQRNSNFIKEHELFSISFYENANRQKMWKSFLRKIKFAGELEFPHVVNSILEKLQPIYYELSNQDSSILAGATEVATKKKSPLDLALEDVRLGRVSTVCTPRNGKKIKK